MLRHALWASRRKISVFLLAVMILVIIIGANPTDGHPVFASRLKKRLLMVSTSIFT